MRINRPDPDLFEIILRHLKEAVVFADSRGRIQIFNPVAVEFFKVKEKQAMGKKLERVIPYKIIRKQFDSVYEHREGHHDLELAIHFPAVSEEEAQLLRCSFYPVYDRKGIFIGCLATFADITEKGLLSREISQSKDLSTIGMLARWMAHEIRNPLSSLNINIELLRDELREEVHLAQKGEIQSLLNFISYETLRLENNLKEFLDFNRLPPLKFEWVQLNDVLDSIARLLRPDAQMKNARIDVHFQRKLPLVKIDVSQINLAISNLLINSVQAVSERGEIHLLTRASKKNVFIIIKDNGTGISKDHLHKIFDFMFSTKPTGSGLGLSIAKKIISDHHGDITVRSELNRGSTFRIRLPLNPKLSS
ncbi:MAG: PAS domain-containing protein [Deltaproteobacteria bacterium]|nr:PAS domain-containing protein [Deltaproteobacteria bacterium]